MTVQGEWERDWLLRIGSTSPAFWGGIVQMQLRRVERGVEAQRERRPHPERGRDPFAGFGASLTNDAGITTADAYFLLVAVRHLLAVSEVFEERFDADGVRAARERFEVEAPDAKHVRDALANLEEYAMRAGEREGFDADGQWILQLGDPECDELNLRAGTLRVELRRTADAAVALARELSALGPPA